MLVLFGDFQASASAPVSKVRRQEYQQLSEQQINDAYALLSLEPKKTHTLAEIEGAFRQILSEESDRVFGPKPFPGSSRRRKYTQEEELALTTKMQKLKNAVFIVETNQQDRKYWGHQGQEVSLVGDAQPTPTRSVNSQQVQNFDPYHSVRLMHQKLNKFLDITLPDDIWLEKTLGNQTPIKYQVGLKGETVRSALSRFGERNILQQDYPAGIEKLLKDLRQNWENNNQIELLREFFTQPQLEVIDILPGVWEGSYYDTTDTVEQKLAKFLHVRLLSDFCLLNSMRSYIVCAHRGETVKEALQWLHNIRADDSVFTEFFNFMFFQFENSPHATIRNRPGISGSTLEKRQRNYFFPKEYTGNLDDSYVDWRGYIHKDLLRKVADSMRYTGIDRM